MANFVIKETTLTADFYTFGCIPGSQRDTNWCTTGINYTFFYIHRVSCHADFHGFPLTLWGIKKIFVIRRYSLQLTRIYKLRSK